MLILFSGFYSFDTPIIIHEETEGWMGSPIIARQRGSEGEDGNRALLNYRLFEGSRLSLRGRWS